MSRKTELLADLKRIGYLLGSARLTREARSTTFNAFASTLHELGYNILSAHQIGGKHLQAFAAHRAGEGISARTRANELSHLRAVIVHIGKQGLRAIPPTTIAALSIERGSRVGTKRPLSDAAIVDFRERMAQLGRPGIGETLKLQRALGLREMEALRGGQTDTLARWQRELQDRGSVRVVEGTKADDPEKFIRRTCIALRWRCRVRRPFYKRLGSGIWSRKPTARQRQGCGKRKVCTAISAIAPASEVTQLDTPSRESAWRLIAMKATASARREPQHRRIWATAMVVAASSRASMHAGPDRQERAAARRDRAECLWNDTKPRTYSGGSEDLYHRRASVQDHNLGS
jgi:hypothetical protein